MFIKFLKLNNLCVLCGEVFHRTLEKERRKDEKEFP
jgi:hypothetical protein